MLEKLLSVDMFLYLDTSSEEAKIKLFNKSGKIHDQKNWQSQKNQSEELLTEIDNILLKNNLNKSELFGIIVNQGPGSYTGLRVGLSTANAIAFSLNIPILGVKNGANSAKIKKIVSSFDKGSQKSLILPVYKYPAKITKPKPRP